MKEDIYNEKNLIAIFTCLALLSSLFTFNTFASPNEDNHMLISENDFSQYLESHKSIPVPRNWCCGMAELRWRYLYTMHIYPNGGGQCLSVAYVGDQYCINCGTIWQYETVYEQRSGCGKYHN